MSILRSAFYDRPYVLLVLTALFWAGNTIAGKLASGLIPPFSLTFFRWLAVLTIAFVLARPYLKEHRETIAQNALTLLGMGALGFSLFNNSLYTALNFTSALNAGIEQGTFPAVILFLMFAVYGERISLLQAVGVFLALLGAVTTLSAGSIERLWGLEFNIGDIIMMLGVLSFAIYSIMLRRKPDMPWQVFFFVLSLGGFVASVPFYGLDLIEGRYPAQDWQVLGVLTYVVLFPSLVSQVFWIRGVELIGAGRSSLFINLIPIFATLLAVIILGETFRFYHAVGLVCVLGGIGLAEWSGRQRAQRAATVQPGRA